MQTTNARSAVGERAGIMAGARAAGESAPERTRNPPSQVTRYVAPVKTPKSATTWYGVGASGRKQNGVGGGDIIEMLLLATTTENGGRNSGEQPGPSLKPDTTA